jgi:hypothetical protein
LSQAAAVVVLTTMIAQAAAALAVLELEHHSLYLLHLL